MSEKAKFEYAAAVLVVVVVAVEVAPILLILTFHLYRKLCANMSPSTETFLAYFRSLCVLRAFARSNARSLACLLALRCVAFQLLALN